MKHRRSGTVKAWDRDIVDLVGVCGGSNSCHGVRWSAEAGGAWLSRYGGSVIVGRNSIRAIGVEDVSQKLRRSRLSCISHFGRGGISKSCGMGRHLFVQI